MKNTKTKLDELRERSERTGESFEELRLGLPFVEGAVLEELLSNPQNIIVQRLVPADKELRLHVVEGKILRGATFLRFFDLGIFLTEEEISSVERSIEELFLRRLPKNARNLSCSMDVMVEKETGRLAIIDLNVGLFSGYFHPEESLHATNLLAEFYSGKPTPFLSAFREFEKIAFDKKARKLKEILDRFGNVLSPDGKELFWHYVASVYVRELKNQPTAVRFDQILSQMRSVGLSQPWAYHRFIAEVGARWPNLVLSPSRLSYWVLYLRSLGGGVTTYSSERKIRFAKENKTLPSHCALTLARFAS